jgi:hypothetical protein
MTKDSSILERAADVGAQARLATAQGLYAAADAARDCEDVLPGGKRVRRFTRATADGLESSARYLRRHDLSRIAGDLTTMVKRNPVPSIVAGAAIGFIVGRMLTRE